MQKEIKEYTGKLSKIKYTFSEIIHNHRHYLLLLYWPLFGLAFNIAESGKFTGAYHLIRCGLDERIPFCEYFVIPYILWFAFVALTCAYTLFFEKDVFVRYMKFIIIGYTVAIIAFFVYPSAHNLRPVVFDNPNIFTSMVLGIYSVDTSTNIFPSIHVIGSLAVLFAVFDSKRLSRSIFIKAFFTAMTASICLSTVFIKQHSVIDVIAALILCAAIYPFCFLKRKSQNNQCRHGEDSSPDKPLSSYRETK